MTIDQAINILRQGGIVIYPTDTAFGIGCRVDRVDAVEKLFELRRRPLEKATPILVSSIEMAKAYMDTPRPSILDQLMESYWPGALTIIYFSHTPSIASRVKGGGETVGIRMPDHEIALRLIDGVGVPIVGCSANFAGGQTPHAYKDLDQQLISLVDGVLEGECKHSQSSTVVDCTNDPYTIIRQGAVLLK